MSRFIGEPIRVEFNGQPRLQKRTGCPVRFLWRGDSFPVTGLLSEWHDYGRRGDMANNMTPAHARAALRRGSRGVGRDYYRVQTAAGRVFVLYYDRAPKNVDDSLGGWFLLEEEIDDSSAASGSRKDEPILSGKA